MSGAVFDSNGAQQGHDSTGRQSYFFTTEELRAVDDLWSSYDFYQENTDKGSPLPPNYQQYFSETVAMDEMQFDSIPAAVQSFQKPVTLETSLEKSSVPEIADLLGPKKDKASSVTLSSLELLNNYRPSYNRSSNGGNLIELIGKEKYPTGGKELSTGEIVRIAGARYIQISMHTEGDLPMLMHPFGLSFSGLSVEEIRSVDLTSLLLAAAEKVSNQQYERASNLLRQCDQFSSNTGNPVQRVVYYFSDALRERIGRETGRISSKGSTEKEIPAQATNKETSPTHPIHLVTHKTLPFAQILQFTSIQAILDSVASAERIHLIDLSLKHGLHWTILMQALATRSSYPIEYLKISAVGTMEEPISATGNRLVNFAKTLNLPFEFKAVIVSDMVDLTETMFELEDDEAVGVYSSMVTNRMILRRDCLDNLMRVLQNIRPCIVTVMDVEANHNSPSFINRFTEALFYASAFFDCLEECMDRNDSNRMLIEGSFFSQGIRSIAKEGSERIARQVGISTWRSFFARFGLLEAKLNDSSLYQASLIVKQVAHGNSCTLERNGKSLTVGWKGTPLLFVSAWKFQ